MTSNQMTNSKTAFHEAKNCKIIARAIATQKMSLITAFRVQLTQGKHNPHLLMDWQRDGMSVIRITLVMMQLFGILSIKFWSVFACYRCVFPAYILNIFKGGHGGSHLKCKILRGWCRKLETNRQGIGDQYGLHSKNTTMNKKTIKNLKIHRQYNIVIEYLYSIKKCGLEI